MFNLFKNQSQDYFDNAFAALDKKWFENVTSLRTSFEKQLEAVSKVQPIVTQSEDAVTVTFKSPNVTTTITASKGNLPEVLKKFGLEMPTMATKPKTVAKKKAKDAK
jgi:hypothetical protein